MRELAHERYEELAAGHALDALEPEDEQVFLQHLAACARCERDLDEHRVTAGHLAHGAEPVALPPGLFDRIRAEVVAESGEEVFAGPAPLAPVVPLDARRRRLPRPATLVAAAAAAVLVAALGASNLALRQDRVERVTASDRLQQAVEAIEAGGQSVPLLDDAHRVAAVAVVQDDEVSLVVEGLAPNADRTTYVLWERGRFGSLRALGTFDVRDGGVEVVAHLPLRSGADDVAAFAITHEEGDSAPSRPLTAPVASGDVEQA